MSALDLVLAAVRLMAAAVIVYALVGLRRGRRLSRD